MSSSAFGGGSNDVGWSDEFYATFLASLRSVGTACTLASVGIYLHRRNFIVGDGKRTLALISQQVTIPLLFCTKIIYCNQDWSADPCPDITQSLQDVWVLLIWPLYVVGMGLIVGHFVATWSLPSSSPLSSSSTTRNQEIFSPSTVAWTNEPAKKNSTMTSKVSTGDTTEMTSVSISVSTMTPSDPTPDSPTLHSNVGPGNEQDSKVYDNNGGDDDDDDDDEQQQQQKQRKQRKQNKLIREQQYKAILAACAFGNSTGLPITLLTVVHTNFPSTTDLGRIDPTLFLSVYLLLYPVLQWGVGGWLLAPPSPSSDRSGTSAGTDSSSSFASSASASASSTSSVSSSYKRKQASQATDEERQLLAAQTSIGTDTDTSRRTRRSQRKKQRSRRSSSRRKSRSSSIQQQHVLHTPTNQLYQWIRRGMDETDASMYMSVPEHLHSYHQQYYPNQKYPGDVQSQAAGMPIGTSQQQDQQQEEDVDFDPNMKMTMTKTESLQSIGMNLSRENSLTGLAQLPSSSSPSSPPPPMPLVPHTETEALLSHDQFAHEQHYDTDDDIEEGEDCYDDEFDHEDSAQQGDGEDDDGGIRALVDIGKKIAQRCLQPPVVGALLGMFIASIPALRGIFVDLIDRTDDAPLEWFFDGLYHVGQAAVPINMIILGCNLSASWKNNSSVNNNKSINNSNMTTTNTTMFSTSTMIAIVFGKMVIMPIIGIVSAFLFRHFIWNIPDDIAGSFYLVVLIVFLTPTANNVMVMVELSTGGGNGSGGNNNANNKANNSKNASNNNSTDNSNDNNKKHGTTSSSSSSSSSSLKEGIARVIAWQYAAAPIILSLTMTVAVGIADQWS